MFALELAETIRWTSLLVGVSLLLGAFEHLAILREYRGDGLYSWKVFGSQFPEFSFPLARPLFSVAFGYGGVCVLLSCTVIAALFLITPGLSATASVISIAIALASRFALAYRNFYGSDGSDQMETMVLAGLGAAFILWPSSAAKLGIAFIAAQSALSYCASGVSKLVSRTWMSGDAAFRIFNTYTYGNGFTASILRRYPRLARPLCWLIVAYECAFPLCLILPWNVAVAILSAGLVFHLLNAWVMGLNKFVWAFLATYPALLYCNREIAGWLAAR